MNMSPLELEVLRMERLQELKRLDLTQVSGEFTALPQRTSVIGTLISQTKQWFQNRQFRSESARRRRAHAAA